MSLRGTVNSVGPLQSSVEPLRTIWRGYLIEQHPGNFVVERLRVLRRGEVAKLLAPMFPATSQPMHNLFHGSLWTKNGFSRGIHFVLAGRVHLRHACLAEIFAHHNVRCQLTPRRRDFSVIHFKHRRPVAITNATCASAPLNCAEDVLSWTGESWRDLHVVQSLNEVAKILGESRRRGLFRECVAFEV